ncbi:MULTISPECIES: site-specific integrase [unclassified Bradyrhizobium]|uniref:tyrosine-type recombinase/integrase n=1 Tax=unclassified Bradyrhizobium TaxID=2631580 RepID=UPI002479B558|nr:MULTISPECIES: site-specific integrase [unclassified Bradyrhizobium]WGR70332.1 site-specific integrase [Bradyrhizobium sp. ISRA426]WGR82391.1 site-specific integrase [Bradyrhizobium sp. ISRA430]WGR85577.1 site-specific integrase [Bradyrhizobium sp. ISRA432]
MPQLYFTDLGALRRPAIVDGVTHELSEEVIAGAESSGLVDGMPFILGHDGSYDHDLNRFFRACPTMGVRSLNSLRAYARDIVVWLRFLAERRDGKSVWSVDRDDIAAFHEARRLSPPPHRISASSWNRAVAALDKLYRWAVEEKLIAKAPFTYRQAWTRALDGSAISVAANMARETAARNGDMRFVSLDRYLLFRDVGLRGRLPDGREDATWRGRNGERNALFAELLVTTGLRLQEASHLLTVELPAPDRHQGQRSVPFRLAAATAKGSKAREVRLPARLLERLRDYADVERVNALARWRERRSWMRIDAPMMVTGHDRQSLHLDHGRVRFDRLNPGERGRLLHEQGKEPLALWLTEGGLPMPMTSWQAVFRRASARCRGFGINIEVTPHMLRHSFAVHMLTLLLREQIGWMLEERAGRMSPAYRRLIGDPLLKLQRLMGHSRIESTYIYLDHLDDSQALVDAAVEQWGLDVASVRDVA